MTPGPRSLLSRIAILLSGYMLACIMNLYGQVPDNFTNLQVLRKDIGKGELLDYMKGFTRALGVRCQHCHIGKEGQPLDTFDFVTDAKRAKQTTRVMLQMVRSIDDEHLAKVMDRSAPPILVSCVTCHRGQDRPRMLEEVLHETIATQGMKAGIAKYRELRERYYGGFVFDFGESTLMQLARQLQAEDKNDAALALLKLNTEFNPNSWMNYFQTAELYLMQEDKTAALEHYKKSLELNPQNPIARRKVDELMRVQK